MSALRRVFGEGDQRLTLAAIAQYPRDFVDAIPEKIRRLLQVYPQFRPTPAILLIADSRWSWKIGEDYDDGGVKLVSLDSHVGAIYAGSVAAGENALAQLTAAFREARVAGTHAYVEPERILREVWRRHRHPNDVLQLCLGGFLGSAAEPVAFRFDSISQFRAQPIQGIEAIGWPDAIVYFLRRLAEDLGRESAMDLTEKALALTPDHWCTKLGLLLLETAASEEANLRKTAGDSIQAAIITPSGMEGRSLSRISFQRDQPDVRQLTLSDQEVTAFYKRHGRKPPHKLPLSRPGARA